MGPQGPAGPAGAAGAPGAWTLDDSTGATIAQYAGAISVDGSSGYVAMALRFDGYDVPVLYWDGGRNSSTSLEPYVGTVYYSGAGCTGTPKSRAYAVAEQGYLAFGVVVDVNSSVNVYVSSGVKEIGGAYASTFDGSSCTNSSSTDNFFLLTDITGASTPPASIPFGFTVRAS